ncbi:MAG: SidJ-related pseudokinase [Desulfobacterales bacterium]|nr:MAG: SidJ-related pseudokinase [Desulfobacterales bacterium]
MLIIHKITFIFVDKMCKGFFRAMTTWSVKKERIRLEKLLCNQHLDFSANYMAIQQLHALLKDYPQLVRPSSVSALHHVLKDRTHIPQKQSLFLYRAAADALISVVKAAPDNGLGEQSMHTLRQAVDAVSGAPQRAAAEALASLPLTINGPVVCYQTTADIPHVKWEDLLSKNGFSVCRLPTMFGRSLVAKIDKDNRLLVIKVAHDEHSVQLLNKEALWMDLLSSKGPSFPVRFNIPEPIKFKESFVFRLQNPPLKHLLDRGTNSTHYAIGFKAHNDYFVYPNEIAKGRLARQRFKETLFRNAWLFGKLTAMGIVHSAPIPLFHNRLQQARRADRGIYEWHRGGRLDRWLYSCRYPNFGPTGIRDFEHFMSIAKPGVELYRYIGSHLLSLLLVTGSYFRNKAKGKCGFDANGAPIDTRDLFDRRFFQELIRGVFLKYYRGFVGKKFEHKMAFDFEALTCRMIEEMGVDRHMFEILRKIDQRAMTDQAFRAFLNDNGFTDRETDRIEKGREDITIHSGPHLGGFNERISLPELIAFLSMTSAFCVAGKFLCGRKANV